MIQGEPTIHKYPGNCHCGSVRFEIHLASPFQTTFACPCSICAKAGCPWIFTQDDELKFTKGRDTLASYKTQMGEYEFCATCGTPITVRNHLTVAGQPGIGVSARALRDVNPFHLSVTKLPPPREDEPASSAPEVQPTQQSPKTYTGGCHCGAIHITVTSAPLRDVQVKEDNCSICQRNANTCIYPAKCAVATQDPSSQLREYRFGRKFTGHRFCGVCGVQLYMHLYGPPAAVVARLLPEKQELVRRNLEIVPVRVQVLDGVEWEEIHVERSDEGTEGYVLGA
ncbi:hypothetical protein BO99DRAFT_404942 [Aspergillus violaceofuscus CBS 115571]|uniref:CENP-V/GFA domain-containing protein n=1 Tax=Aspergillus violaceofuscus (strain CBS 115571) TaxID=1450538 RepID=A0A2V5GYW0_ASPV1|nr:hypothetical protein BO99DRAFT_404942 [Aspergillus violaceofuscus CBS 115571]